MADSHSDSSKREQALEFLDEMEVRHDHLLQELDALNLRIDAILDAYTKSRGPHLANTEQAHAAGKSNGLESATVSNSTATIDSNSVPSNSD